MDTSVKKRRPAITTYGKSSTRKRPLSDAFSSLSFGETEEGSGSTYATPTQGSLNNESASPADGQMSQFGKQPTRATSSQQAPARNGKSRTTELPKRRPKLAEARREQQSSQELRVFDIPSSGSDEEPGPRPTQRNTRQLPAARVTKTTRPALKGGKLASSERLRVGKDKEVSSLSSSAGGSRSTSARGLNKEDSGSGGIAGNKTEKLPSRPELRTRRTTPSATLQPPTAQTTTSTQLHSNIQPSANQSLGPSQINNAPSDKVAPVFVAKPENLENVPRRRERLHRPQPGASNFEQPSMVRKDSSEGKKTATLGASKLIAEPISRVKTPMRPPPTSHNLSSANASTSLLFETPDPNAKWFSETHAGDFTLTCDESIWDTILDDGPPQKKKSITRKASARVKRAESADSAMKEAIHPLRRKLIHGLKEEEEELEEESSEDEEMGDDGDGEQNNSQAMSHADFQSQMEMILGSTGDSQDPTSPKPMNSLVEPAPDPGGFVRRSGPSITYARQRSYLTEEMVEGSDLFADPLLLPARDYGSRFQPKAVEEDLEDEDQGNVKMMKSLHELREAGVNKRFLDTVEGHFEDIEGDVALGRKRAGYLDLATKIRDKAFLQKFRANNFDRRLIQGLEKETDEVIQFVLSFIIWNFMHEDSTIQTAKNNGIIPMLIRMLDSERDIKVIAKDRKTNMSKAAQSLVADFCTLVDGSSMFPGRKPKSLSPRIVALQVLDSIMKKLRQSGWMEDCLPTAGVKKLVGILHQFISPKDPQKIKLLDPLLLELPVSILESNSLGTGISMDTELSTAELGVLAQLLQSTMSLDFEGVKPLQLLITRLGISLTTTKSAVCEVYAGSNTIPLLIQITQAKFEALSGALEEEERLVELDMLVLTLALMNNFAEWSEEARLEFLSQENSEVPPVSVLLKLFLDRLDRIAEAESMEETQSNVGFGYLSILLGNLCQNASVRKVIRSQMPKGSLEPLMDAVHEFVAHNRKVDDERRALMDLDDDEDGKDENYYRQHAERLEKVAVDLRGYGG